MTDKDGYTPLHRAAYGNHLEVLKVRMSDNYIIYMSHGKTKHIITYVLCSQVLLEYGADYNAETLDKWTPLHSACHWNSAQCAEKLLSLDLNINAQSEGGKYTVNELQNDERNYNARRGITTSPKPCTLGR